MHQLSRKIGQLYVHNERVRVVTIKVRLWSWDCREKNRIRCANVAHHEGVVVSRSWRILRIRNTREWSHGSEKKSLSNYLCDKQTHACNSTLPRREYWIFSNFHRYNKVWARDTFLVEPQSLDQWARLKETTKSIQRRLYVQEGQYTVPGLLGVCFLQANARVHQVVGHSQE